MKRDDDLHSEKWRDQWDPQWDDKDRANGASVPALLGFLALLAAAAFAGFVAIALSLADARAAPMVMQAKEAEWEYPPPGRCLGDIAMLAFAAQSLAARGGYGPLSAETSLTLGEPVVIRYFSAGTGHVFEAYYAGMAEPCVKKFRTIRERRA